MNSLRKGKCLSQSCKYRHIKGTTRHEIDGKAKDPHHTTSNSSHPKQTSDETKNAQNPVNITDHFLDAIRLLKAELLAEMDKRLDKVVQTQARQQPMFCPHQLPPHQPPQLPQQMLQQQQQSFIKQPQGLLNSQMIPPPQFYPQSATTNKPSLQHPFSLPITQTQQTPQ